MDLKHVAIIPDGNRRWAQRNSLSALSGHNQGVKSFEKISKKAAELKIPYLTLWGASYDNLTKRSNEEINNLLKIFHEQFKRLLNEKDVEKYQVKIRVIGKFKEIFPQKTLDLIEKCIQKTKNYQKHNLTILLAYNGTDEMIECIKKIKGEVNHQTIKQNLWTKDLPPVDLIIRTGSKDDPHLSAGFMMWDTAYSQLYFTKTFFPDFDETEFELAINDFNQRQKRKGK